MALEAQFAALERRKGWPRGRRSRPFAGREPAHTLVWECELPTLAAVNDAVATHGQGPRPRAPAEAADPVLPRGLDRGLRGPGLRRDAPAHGAGGRHERPRRPEAAPRVVPRPGRPAGRPPGPARPVPDGRGRARDGPADGAGAGRPRGGAQRRGPAHPRHRALRARAAGTRRGRRWSTRAACRSPGSPSSTWTSASTGRAGRCRRATPTTSAPSWSGTSTAASGRS